METIVALGKPAIRLAREFNHFPQYKIISIGPVDSERFDAHIQLEPGKTPEDTENQTPQVETSMQSPVLFILVGGSSVSPASLRILEQLKEKEIHILYIRPDVDFLSSKDRRMEKIVFGVLQEYARSNCFERMFVVSNSAVAASLGETPISELYSKINKQIAHCVHMLNVLDHSVPMISSFSDFSETSKIFTIGISTLNSEEVNFYDLEETKEKRFYVAVPKTQINSDPKLLENIKNKVKQDKTINKQIAVYPTDYTETFIYTLSATNKIQSIETVS